MSCPTLSSSNLNRESGTRTVRVPISELFLKTKKAQSCLDELCRDRCFYL